jgi:copper chaperone CopZ
MKIAGIGAGLAALAAAALCLVGVSAPESKIEVKGLHLCCGGCEGAAKGAVEGAGAKGAMADKASGTLSFTVANDKVAQKALDALAAAGFHGDTGNKLLALKDDSGLPPQNPKKPVTLHMVSVTLKIPHNCCEGCAKPIIAAIMKVEGVESQDVKAKSNTATVKGNFDPVALIKAINEAGYHVKIDKSEPAPKAK